MDVYHVAYERGLALVEKAHKVVEARLAVVHLAVRLALLVEVAHVGERETHPSIQVGQVAQPRRQYVKLVDRALEYRGIGVELDGGAVVALGAVAYDAHRAGGLAIGILLHVDVTAAPHLGAQVVAQGVHATHAHAVQTARHLVGTFVKLAAGMQHGHHHLEGRLVQLLVLVDGNAAAVVFHYDRVVLEYGHLYVVAESCQGLVDRVVDYLRHQMVQSLDVCIAYVHRRTLAHGLQAFEHLYVVRRVLFLYFFFS